jgi:hypothetical protein
MSGLALFPFLVLVKRPSSDAEEQAKPYAVRLSHELQHVRQMREDGWLRFVCGYVGSGVQRARYEAKAYVEADLPFLRRRFATLDAAVAAIVERIDTPLYFPTWLARAGRPSRVEIAEIVNAAVQRRGADTARRVVM